MILAGCSSGNQNAENVESSPEITEEAVEPDEYTTDKWEEKEFEGLHFSVPSKWLEAKDEDERIFFAESGFTKAELSITNESSENTIFSKEDAEEALSHYGKDFSDFQFEKDEDIKVDGRDAIAFSFSGEDGSKPILGEAVCFLYNKKTFVFSFMRRGDSRYQYSEIFDSIVESIKSEETNINEIASNAPIVYYDQISEYVDKYVLVPVIIAYRQDKTIGVDIGLWYPTEDSYVYKDDIVSSSSPDIAEEVLRQAEAGEKYYELAMVTESSYIDGEKGFSLKRTGMQKIEEGIDVEAILSEYKESLPELDYEDASRNPGDYMRKPCKVSGKVFQIISEDSASAEYLIKTNDDRIVHISYSKNEKVRGPRILEKDQITAYGQTVKMYEYTALSGNKKVLNVSADFIDID